MKSTIDKAGRIVVPKALRMSLHFEPGTLLELEEQDGRLVIEVDSGAKKLEDRGGMAVIVTQEEIPPLTAEQVRATLESVRR